MQYTPRLSLLLPLTLLVSCAPVEGPSRLHPPVATSASSPPTSCDRAQELRSGARDTLVAGQLRARRWLDRADALCPTQDGEVDAIRQEFVHRTGRGRRLRARALGARRASRCTGEHGRGEGLPTRRPRLSGWPSGGRGHAGVERGLGARLFERGSARLGCKGRRALGAAGSRGSDVRPRACQRMPSGMWTQRAAARKMSASLESCRIPGAALGMGAARPRSEQADDRSLLTASSS